MSNFIRKKLRQTAEQYIRSTNTPGYKYVLGKVSSERYFWNFIHICTLVTTYIIGRVAWDNFMSNPTITTVNLIRSKPVSEVSMPGISVCNINKISKIKAQEYAEKLYTLSGKPVKEIVEGLKLLASLDSYNLPVAYEETFQFQNFLDKYDAGDDGYYNTYDKLKMLQVPCHEMLSDCILHEEKRQCHDVFVSDLTMEGHCCIFNYISQSAKYLSTIIRENGNKPITAGNPRRKGLTFRVKHNVSDYLVTSLATIGVKILVSLPKDFPDTTSGNLQEILVGAGVEAFLRVSSTVTYTTPEVKKYSIEKRGCIFPDETDTIFGGYSSSDCIMDCKIRSIGAICQCIPFNYINVFKGKDFPQCTLADLICLSTYASKWRTMHPTGLKDEDVLAREQQDAVRCYNCVPACSDTRYIVSTDAGELFEKGKRMENLSVVRVFFDPPFVASNTQDVFFYWYDMIGLFGGLCSLVMGVSFISVVELIYYFTYVFYKNLLNKTRQL